MMHRQSNIELLRLLAMAMIVVHHFAYHGAADLSGPLTGPQLGLQWLTIGGNVAVNVFVMISAYFMVDRAFSWRRPLALLAQVCLYSWLITGAYALYRPSYLYGSQLLNLVLPFPGSYWFADYYFLLLLLTPGLNGLLSRIDRDSYRAVLILATGILVLGPSLDMYALDVKWGRLLTFIYLYALVAYIKKYPQDLMFCKGRGGSLALLTYLALLVFLWLAARLEVSLGISLNQGQVLGLNQLGIILLSLSLFAWGLQLKLAQLAWVNRLAGSAFGIYLIHEQPLVRSFLWNQVRNDGFETLLGAYFGGLARGGLVFLACLLAAYLIDQSLGRLVAPWVQAGADYLNKQLPPIDA